MTTANWQHGRLADLNLPPGPYWFTGLLRRRAPAPLTPSPLTPSPLGEGRGGVPRAATLTTDRS